MESQSSLHQGDEDVVVFVVVVQWKATTSRGDIIQHIAPLNFLLIWTTIPNLICHDEQLNDDH